MKRLFTFGCSYTSYSWPTWADLLSVDFEYSENWGLAGVGNRGIAERIAESNVRNKFNSNDTVIVQWSSHLRNDFWHPFSLPERPGTWKTSGSIFNYINEPLYDQWWLDNFFSEEGYLMHTLNNIVLVQELLKASGATWYMTSMGDVRNIGADLVDNGWGAEDVLLTDDDKGKAFVAWEKFPQYKIYDKSIWLENSEHWLTPLNTFAYNTSEPLYDFIDTTNETVIYQDPHPTVKHYAMWVESVLKNKLNISEENISKMHNIANITEEVHQKFKFDKRLFETMLATREEYVRGTMPNWPFRLAGF